MHHRGHRAARRLIRRFTVVGAVIGTALLLTGCGSTHAAGTLNTAVAGQLANGEAAGAGGGLATTSVPLAAQNAITALFTAIDSFQSCLKGQGVTFIGIPDASNPSSPTNDPAYIKTLTTCAAQSNILQALTAAQSSQKNLTLSQIKTENKEYLKWRTCMIGKGWTIPTPKPNAQGLLFNFGGGGGNGAGAAGGTATGGSDASAGFGFTPPPGQTLFSSSDIQTCASEVLG